MARAAAEAEQNPVPRKTQPLIVDSVQSIHGDRSQERRDRLDRDHDPDRPVKVRFLTPRVMLSSYLSRCVAILKS